MAAPAREAVIEVRGLVNRFGSQVVHDGVDLDVHRGEVLAVIGGSGAGKSVLLRSIIGLQQPAAGRIRVFGCDLSSASEAQRAEVEQRWGVMFQDGALFSSLTVLENVMVPMVEHQPLPRDLMEEIARLKIALVGLPADAGPKMPSQLSGGMRKRAGIARALALDPQILFLDEPTSGLDPLGAAGFDELIATLKRSLEADDIAAKLASLSPQQFRVLERVAEGRLNKQIADELGIQERTVKAHMSAIFEKLGVRNRTQAGVLLSTLTLTDPAQSVETEQQEVG